VRVGQDTFDVMEAFGPFGRYFVGGPLLDSLLWFTDFHHLMSPVAGKIVFMMDYPGSYNYDFYDFDPYHPDIPTIPGEQSRSPFRLSAWS
jgi:phosphatidylserine decarboxylase